MYSTFIYKDVGAWMNVGSWLFMSRRFTAVLMQKLMANCSRTLENMSQIWNKSLMASSFTVMLANEIAVVEACLIGRSPPMWFCRLCSSRIFDTSGPASSMRLIISISVKECHGDCYYPPCCCFGYHKTIWVPNSVGLGSQPGYPLRDSNMDLDCNNCNTYGKEVQYARFNLW